MAAKPETTFINLVHKHLPASIYREKMNNPYRSGTPDVYYEGKGHKRGNVLWVEYKWIPYKISPLQLKWLTRAHNNGLLAWVVVGWRESPRVTHCTILANPTMWDAKITKTNNPYEIYTIEEYTNFIQAYV